LNLSLLLLIELSKCSFNLDKLKPIGAKIAIKTNYSVSRLDAIQIRANNRASFLKSGNPPTKLAYRGFHYSLLEPKLYLNQQRTAIINEAIVFVLEKSKYYSAFPYLYCKRLKNKYNIDLLYIEPIYKSCQHRFQLFYLLKFQPFQRILDYNLGAWNPLSCVTVKLSF
jgi:hypothetical protein